jgi:hypothetical protein
VATTVRAQSVFGFTIGRLAAPSTEMAAEANVRAIAKAALIT